MPVIVVPGGMAGFRQAIRKKKLVIPRGRPIGAISPPPSAEEPPVSGDAGDSLALFDEGGVTLLHIGMI